MTHYQLHHGDCLDILPTLAPQSVDAVICDPPYGTTACKWDSVIPFEPMWKELKRIIKPRGAIVLFGSQPFTSALVMSNPGMFRWEDIWDKVNRVTGFLDANRRPLRRHENILVFANGQPTYNPQMSTGTPYVAKRSTSKPHSYALHEIVDTVNSGTRYPVSIIPFKGDNKKETKHDTQKPLLLLEYLVKTYTNEGDTVLDFTFGSGTTGAACGNLSRNFIGIEKDLTYYTQGSDRIASAYAPLRAMEQAS